MQDVSRSVEQPDIVRELQFGSPAYSDCLTLRERVLRAPLGRQLEPADLDGESRQFHFAAYDPAGHLLACVVIKPLADGVRAKLRQMAVAETVQGRGVGKALVLAAEAVVAARGYHLLELSARQAAIGFYERLGYRPLGPLYLELDLPHVKMVKAIDPQPLD